MPASDPIAALVAGTYVDAETGERLRAESRAVAIEDSLDGAEVELVAGLGDWRRIALVADDDTHAALGARVERALGSRYAVQGIALGRAPDADEATVARLAAALAPGTDLVVAVGSGTINDLSKMAALARGVPQVVFATAPSMNGYTSVSASITDARGLKRSVRARTPLGVFFDLSVVATAPARLIRAGLGDSVCRPTAQADWLLAHLLLDQPYREVPFALLADDEAALFADSAALVRGDRAAVRRLARTLVLSGFGMTICGGSYPASQGEHLISHYADMRGAGHALHGEQIGVATLAMATLQARVLSADEPPRLQRSRVTRAEVLAHFGPELGEACWTELAPKLLDDERAEALTARLAATWSAMRARITGIAIAPERVADVLEAAGAITAPDALGWPLVLLRDAFAHAREIRNRYTFLDLVADQVPTIELPRRG